jgi:hypothetical protein
MADGEEFKVPASDDSAAVTLDSAWSAASRAARAAAAYPAVAAPSALACSSRLA